MHGITLPQIIKPNIFSMKILIYSWLVKNPNVNWMARLDGYISRCIAYIIYAITTLRPRRNCRYFADDIFKCTSWMQIYDFRLRYHWRLLLRFELTILQYWFRLRLGFDQAPSHYLTQWWLIYWSTYASLCLDVFVGSTDINKEVVRKAECFNQWIASILVDNKWAWLLETCLRPRLVSPAIQ